MIFNYDVSDLLNAIEAEATEREDVNSAIESGLAIVADGNTHAAVASGQYVYIKNHSTLAEGLYIATAAIPLNDPITASNVSSASSGVLNNIASESSTTVALSNKNTAATVTKIGKICYLESNHDFTSLSNGLQVIGNIPSGFRPARYVRFAILNKLGSQTTSGCYGTVYTDGRIEIYWDGETTSSAMNGAFNFSYLTE